MLRRFDTLFLRLFLLLWAALVVSHLVAWWSVTGHMNASGAPGGPGQPREQRSATQPPSRWDMLPVLPSLPPGNPLGGDESQSRLPPPPPRPPESIGVGPSAMSPPPPPPSGAEPRPQSPGLPRAQLWLDYAIRMAIIALAAVWGARWLSVPMRRLAQAASHLADGLRPGQPAPQLDVTGGTREVRDTAEVFNRMSQRLQQQFDSRSLHMAALSHDLRTPLTRLRMRLERLPPEQAASAAADIREMDEMIDMTLSVLREQREGGEARRIDIAALLQALVDDLADQGREVLCRLGTVPFVRAHPAALRRVLGNLVDNAWRHGGSARIGAHPADGGVEVTIDDDGPGIPVDRIEQAFQPWVQLDERSPGHATGHGLGLAIARDLAERDGARLTLHNREGGGLRARLWVPTWEANADR